MMWQFMVLWEDGSMGVVKLRYGWASYPEIGRARPSWDDPSMLSGSGGWRGTKRDGLVRGRDSFWISRLATTPFSLHRWFQQAPRNSFWSCVQKLIPNTGYFSKKHLQSWHMKKGNAILASTCKKTISWTPKLSVTDIQMTDVRFHSDAKWVTIKVEWINRCHFHENIWIVFDEFFARRRKKIMCFVLISFQVKMCGGKKKSWSCWGETKC